MGRGKIIKKGIYTTAASYQPIKYFKRFLQHKKDLINLNDHRWWIFNLNEVNQMTIINHKKENSEYNYQKNLIYEINSNLTRYIIGLNLTSLISNLISFAISIVFLISGVEDVYLFTYFALFYDIFLLIKHGSLFFFLILTNKILRKHFLRKIY